MTREEQRDKIILEIYELRAKVHTWRFIFGANSSQAKLDEFAEYFTGRMIVEFQNAYETKILVDLRAILDRSEQDVVSIFKVIDREKLIELSKIYRDVNIFTNNCITHKNINRDYTYKFIDVIKTIEELQKLLEDDNQDQQIIWESEKLIQDDLNKLYTKIKRVNRLEKINNN